MRQRSWPGWLALLAGIAVAVFAIVAQEPPSAEPVDAPRDLFSAGRAMQLVEVIAREPHPTGSAQNDQVREIILAKLRELDLEPLVQIPRDASRPERNILARLKGKGPRTKKALLLCAHYDSVAIAPGAGDDASGVAVVIETLRALKVGPGLERDVIALIDDGEEMGMRGASLFVEEHPWAGDIGLALNFDARGNHGPSMMFETTPQNGWLIRQVADVLPHPWASSLSMDLYRIMPNYSDLTVFKRAGMDGLNFAFSRGLAYYHSPEDTPANLDTKSLQHQGENALALARHFGRIDLEDIRREDVIYFSVLNRKLLFYPTSLAMPAALGSAGLLVLAVGIGLIMGRVKLADLLVGIAVWPVSAFAASFAAGAVYLVLRDQMESLGIPVLQLDLPILTLCAFVTAFLMVVLERLAARGRSLEAISLGAIAWWVALAVASARLLPGASYLFTWPAVFILVALILGMMMRRGSGWAKEAIFLGSLPALLLLPPLCREAFAGLSLRLMLPLMFLVALSVGVLLPLLGPIVAPRRPE